MLLTDDLVDEFFGYFDLGGALFTDIKRRMIVLSASVPEGAIKAI